MSFDNMMPCSEEDAEFIEEQASRVFDTIAPPEEAAEEEEFVYKVTDEKGSLLGGCILAVDARKTASICLAAISPWSALSIFRQNRSTKTMAIW